MLTVKSTSRNLERDSETEPVQEIIEAANESQKSESDTQSHAANIYELFDKQADLYEKQANDVFSPLSDESTHAVGDRDHTHERIRFSPAEQAEVESSGSEERSWDRPFARAPEPEFKKPIADEKYARRAKASEPTRKATARTASKGAGKQRTRISLLAKVILVFLFGLIGLLLIYISYLVGQQSQEMVEDKREQTPSVTETKEQTPEPNSVILVESTPPGAEIVHNGAVIGNTPLKVELPAYEQLYLLRLAGYQPQLVRISPNSTESIRLTLQPLDERF